MSTKVTELQGGKEIGLFELEKFSHTMGYSVPKFFVMLNAENKEELIKINEYFIGDDVIVRSNSIMENNEFGFDGIYKSIVVKNCNFENLEKACIEITDSLFSEDAIKYRKKANIEDDSMRIIVQKFIGHKERGKSGELNYFVMETSINAQGDISVVLNTVHDFINKGIDYEEVVMSNKGEVLTLTNGFNFHRELKLLRRLQKIAVELQKVFGPVSLEGAYIANDTIPEVQVFLFQRRVLAKEFYQAEPEIVPDTYKEGDILFRSHSYRGAGKIECLPIIRMPTIANNDPTSWENDLRKKISQLKSDVILFVSTMHLGKISSRILNDYSALSGVKAIISFEKIDFSSHAFKVASLARIPFVSVKSFAGIETLSKGSLFFTKNEAVFCLDEKRKEFRFDLLQKSKAISLVKLIKEKGIITDFSEEKHALGFQLNLKKFSFDNFEIAFHRLLEDVTGEIWLFRNDSIGTIGFKCENSKGNSIEFSGWANYMRNEGQLNLENFREHFKKNKIDWRLIQKIALELNC